MEAIWYLPGKMRARASSTLTSLVGLICHEAGEMISDHCPRRELLVCTTVRVQSGKNFFFFKARKKIDPHWPLFALEHGVLVPKKSSQPGPGPRIRITVSQIPDAFPQTVVPEPRQRRKSLPLLSMPPGQPGPSLPRTPAPARS